MYNTYTPREWIIGITQGLLGVTAMVGVMWFCGVWPGIILMMLFFILFTRN